jgi:hypothetical protein
MNLEKIVAVSGRLTNGLFRVAANRSNGLVVENLETGKRKFVASRQHQFTPLNTVGIYTDDGDAMDITAVFSRMMEQEEDNPPIKHNSSDEELREYFTDILPNHDKDQVYIRDIKKVIKWYDALKKTDLLTAEEETKEETATAAEDATTSSDTTDE